MVFVIFMCKIYAHILERFKMSEIVKVCKKHGQLRRHDCWKRSGETISYKCKKCNKERAYKYYHQDPEKTLEYKRKWREKNKLLNPPVKKPRRQRRIYHPEMEGNVFECKVHGWLTKEFLYFKKIDDFHWQPLCKECYKKKAMENFNKNKENMLSRNKLKRINNSEEVRRKDRELYWRNVDVKRKQSRESRSRNIEKVKISQKKYRENNKEKLYLTNKKYIEENKEKVKERRIKYNLIRYDHLKQKRKEWALKNKEYLKNEGKKHRKKAIENLYDCYVRTILKTGNRRNKNEYTYMKGIYIPQELVELKRTTLIAKRKLKGK